MKQLVSIFTMIVITLLAYTSLFKTTSIFAATPEPTPPPWFFHTFESFYKVINDRADKKAELQKEGYGLSWDIERYYSIAGLIAGGSANPKDSMYIGKSALANVGNATGFMYNNPPASTYAFVQDMGQSIGFIPKSAYAQGIGFSGMQPLLPIWKAFRNIAYLLLAVVMVVIGFMIMFRKKIDPKTVITVQNALPQIIITLLLITFSYAIVGLMIDMMYLVTSFGISILSAQITNGKNIGGTYMNGGFLALIGGVFTPLVTFSLSPTVNFWSNLTSFQFGEAIKNIGEGLLLYGSGLGPIFLAILSVAYLFALVRIFFMLLSAYINIIFSLLVAPIQILFDAIPGGNNFSSWIKNLLSNLIPFPVTILLLTLGETITKPKSGLWQPPLLPGGEFSGALAMTIIWLGLVLTIPSIVHGIRESLKAKPAMAGGMGAVFGPLGAGVGQVTQLGYQALMIKGAYQRKPGSDTLPDQTTAAKQGMKG